MQLEKIKEKIFDILIIGLALIIANNIYKAQSKHASVLKEQKNIELNKQEALNNIIKSNNKISNLRGYMNKRDKSLIINSLTDIAKDCFIRIESLKPRKEEVRAEYTMYPFELTVNTDGYHILGKFISKLENSEDFFTIKDLDFRSTDRPGAEGRNKLAVNLVITTLLIKD